MSENHGVMITNLPGTIGGAVAGTVTGINNTLLLSINLDHILEAVIITAASAFIGAIIGFFTNKGLKKLFGK